VSAVSELMLEDLTGPVPQGLPALLAPLRQTFGAGLLGVVLYGSCRRRAQLDDGLVDLLVIVSDYRRTYGAGLSALLNRLLPPNVYYLEVDQAPERLRSKYAVISLAQFKRRCRHPVDLYFWARFSQPCRLVLAEDKGLAAELAEARAVAARRFAGRIAPLRPKAASAVEFWSFALATTYRCELRPEPPGAARRLVEADPDYWARLSAALAAEGLQTLAPADPAPPPGDQPASRIRRLAAHSAWMGRRLTGKLYNLARLFKAAGTFSNGIDYIVWKVERHSGVRVEPTDRMRRYPRLAAWGLAWRLWRQKGFR